MIKVTRQGEGYISPLFLKELKLINQEFFPLWNVKSQKWMICSLCPSHVNRKGYVEEYAVSKDDEYTPLDERTLRDLRRLAYLKNKLACLDEHLEEMDEADKIMYDKSLKEYRGMKMECLKKVHKLQHSKTFS